MDIDGKHPWQHLVPEACVMYSVRELSGGSVKYFNFSLAKEMGLIPESHPEKLSSQLEKALLKTFYLRIINEHDIQNQTQFPSKSIKKNKYMATRYLQLQHKNKKGGTSGDGRVVWNGIVKHKGKIWDVSSRGTGVTRLSPGFQENQGPLKTGNEVVSYGCGRAELDELYSTALGSEIFHKQNIPTERTLLIIDGGKGFGIGVRTSLNLFRPAHLFNWVKQGNLETLKKATDYLIERQIQNKQFTSTSKSSIYTSFFENLGETFAKVAALYERNYVFAWMDWDGDNILIQGGIIDYGSIRHLGSRYDQYRYDDRDRWSTNLNEQKGQFKLIVQTFLQIMDFLNTGTKKPIAHFKRHKTLKKFDVHFASYKTYFFLESCGFSSKFSTETSHKYLKRAFLKQFEHLEKKKSGKRKVQVADGVNHQPLLNMRKFPHVMIESFLEREQLSPMDCEKLYASLLHPDTLKKDKKPKAYILKKLDQLQKSYIKLIQKGRTRKKKDLSFLEELHQQVKIKNPLLRLTGDGIIHLTNAIVKNDKSGKVDIQEFLTQTLNSYEELMQGMHPDKGATSIFKIVLNNLESYHETL